MPKPAINDRTLRSILAQAVDHRRYYPVCRGRPEATWASGSAVVGLALNVIKDGLCELYRKTVLAITKLRGESHCDGEHLQWHTANIVVICRLFCSITGRPGITRPARRAKGPGTNPARQVFARLPKKHLVQIKTLFDEIQKLLNEITNCMADASRRVRESRPVNIELVMKQEAADRLALIGVVLEHVIPEVENLKNNIATGVWRNSVSAIREDPRCVHSPKA